jgi:hypothetical protein
VWLVSELPPSSVLSAIRVLLPATLLLLIMVPLVTDERPGSAGSFNAPSPLTTLRVQQRLEWSATVRESHKVAATMASEAEDFSLIRRQPRRPRTS